MTKEQQPSSIEQLEAQKKRFTQILGERKLWYESIGAGRVKIGEDWQQDVRIGKVKARVRVSVERLQGQAAVTEREIVIRRKEEEESLTARAQSYINQVGLRRQQLGEIRKYICEGHLPGWLLEKREQEFRFLTCEPGRNPELKRAIVLWKKRQEEVNKEKERRLQAGEQLEAERGIQEEKRIREVWLSDGQTLLTQNPC